MKTWLACHWNALPVCRWGARRQFLGILACMLAAASAGCGGSGKLKVYPTEGSLSMDGEPLGPASFLLLPESIDAKNPRPSVSGQVDADGKITFSCYANGDGAPAGDYEVQFMPSVMGKPKKPIPQAYSSPKQNKLKIKILESTKDKPNVVKFDLDSKLKSAGTAMATGGGGPQINSKYPPIDPALMPKTSP